MAEGTEVLRELIGESYATLRLREDSVDLAVGYDYENIIKRDEAARAVSVLRSIADKIEAWSASTVLCDGVSTKEASE